MIFRRAKKKRNVFDYVDWVSGYDPADEELTESVPSVDELLKGDEVSREVKSDIEAVRDAESKRPPEQQ